MATREDLYAALDRYLEALLARDPAQLEWAPGALTTENNVALEPGDGLWNTVTGIGPYDLRFADVESAQIALFTTVEETFDTSGGNRIENGVQTTNNPKFFVPVAGLPCEEQFRLGNYRYDDRLRGRRFPLVDEERGIVLAHGFIDHCGILGDYELTDSTKISSPIRRPHTFYLSEAFKIRDGAIEQIEANFITVPYHMPSPWDSRA